LYPEGRKGRWIKNSESPARICVHVPIFYITLHFAGIILGPSSSWKTAGIESLREFPTTYYTDSFTPKSFVSHNTGVSKKELERIDMLPKIKDKA
jgi:hypothetical protein